MLYIAKKMLFEISAVGFGLRWMGLLRGGCAVNQGCIGCM